MIYIKNTPKKQQTVVIPTTGAIVGAYTLSLFSTVDRREVLQVLRYGTGKRLSVSAKLTVPDDLADGEYEYRITVGKEVTDTGLAFVGERITEKQYHENVQYKQYGEK